MPSLPSSRARLPRRPALLALLGSALLAACGEGGSRPSAARFKAVDITGAAYGEALRLPDVEGRERSLADFRGQVVVVFFGYTQCPDVCPTTLGELAALKQRLGADGERLQAIFVTVDPERDTPELLKAYMAAFGPGFLALRGTPEQLKAVAQGFKVFYQKAQGTTPGQYTMDHTAGAYVFDPAGRARLFVRYGQPLADWDADLRQLLAGA